MTILKSHLRPWAHGLGGLAIAGALLVGSITQAEAQTNFRLTTLGPGTSPYVVSTVFADLVGNATDYQIQVDATGTGPQHAMSIAQGHSHFNTLSPNLAQLMLDGEAMFSSVPQAPELAQNIRAVFSFPMGLYHATVYADSGIESYSDLAGKRVFTGPPAGAAQRATQTIIEAMTGYRAGEDYREVNIGWDAAAQSFQDRNVDVYFNPTMAPSPILTQIAMSNKLRFLSIPEAQSEALTDLLSNPGYRLVELPSDAYGDNQVNTEPALSLGVTLNMVTNRDVPEEVVYQVTKAFWEGLEKRKQSVRQLNSISLEEAFLDINVPLHPGAVRYYQEIGLEVPVSLLEK